MPLIRVLSVRGGVRFNGLDLSLFAQNALDYHTPLFVSRDLFTSPLNGYPYNFDNNYFGRGYCPAHLRGDDDLPLLRGSRHHDLGKAADRQFAALPCHTAIVSGEP